MEHVKTDFYFTHRIKYSTERNRKSYFITASVFFFIYTEKKKEDSNFISLNIKQCSYGSQSFHVFVEHPYSPGSSTETVNTIQVRIYLPKAVAWVSLSLLLM